jgi:ABC-type maltose transport system permease subunit
MFIFAGFIKGIPLESEEEAMIDGIRQSRWLPSTRWDLTGQGTMDA